MDGWIRKGILLSNMMAVSEGGPMFIKAVNCEHEVKDRFYIANLIKEAIVEVGPQYVVQVITDNAAVCRAAGLIIQGQYHNIFWTPCVVHTLNLALKNICAPKNSLENQNAYEECSWISEIASDALIIKNFIMNHSMRLAIYNQFVKLRLLSIATTRFASVVVMLKRFDAIKQGLKAMVVSEEWSMYKDDDVGKANFVKEKVLDDGWWEKIAYILSFTEPIYNMLRETDTDKPTLHSVYELWDSMIVQVKKVIYAHERKQGNEESTFYNVVHNILVARWSKSTTPLHCLAHSLNPRFYTPTWINGGPNRVEPHVDAEISLERKKCFIKLFPNEEERRLVNIEFGKFSGMMDEFSDPSTLRDRCVMEPKLWWIVHGSSTPKLQALAIRLLSQPSSSSGCERNWSTYSFINSLKRNKLTPKRAEDLVFVHSNLRLLSRKSIQYMQGETRMWDIAGDAFESLDNVGVLEIAKPLS